MMKELSVQETLLVSAGYSTEAIAASAIAVTLVALAFAASYSREPELEKVVIFTEVKKPLFANQIDTYKETKLLPRTR